MQVHIFWFGTFLGYAFANGYLDAMQALPELTRRIKQGFGVSSYPPGQEMWTAHRSHSTNDFYNHFAYSDDLIGPLEMRYLVLRGIQNRPTAQTAIPHGFVRCFEAGKRFREIVVEQEKLVTRGGYEIKHLSHLSEDSFVLEMDYPDEFGNDLSGLGQSLEKVGLVPIDVNSAWHRTSFGGSPFLTGLFLPKDE